MEFQSVSRNCIKEWYILRTLLFLVFVGAFAVFFFIPAIDSYQEILKMLLLICWAMLTLLVAAWAFILPKLQYKNLKYRIDSSRIEKRSGVIFLRQQFVPFVRIQHMEIFRGITDRMFDMATVILHTAGSFVRITNLGIEQADELIAKIKRIMTETEGGAVND